MYPPSPFAVPVGSFQSPVPVPQSDPEKGPLFYIPVNCEWMPYVAGALSQLLLQATWDTSDLDLLSLTQQRVANLIALFNCATAQTLDKLCGVNGAEGDDCMGCCLRFQDGKLQMMSCGEWVDVPGQSNPAVPPLQPAEGALQPSSGGGCATYHATMIARESFLIPTPVNENDTIMVSNLNGASNIGGDPFWFGPNGLLYFAGSYQEGTGGFVSTDPVPGAFTQSLIIHVGGNYYTLFPGPFTVPAGVVNEQPTIVLNSDAPTDLFGTVQFDVEVCNEQPVEWVSDLDFTISSYNEFITTLWGTWIPGVGYKGTFQDSNDISDVQLHIASMGGAHITQMRMRYTTPGQGGTNGLVGFETQAGFFGSYVTPGAVTNAELIIDNNATGVTDLYADNNSGTVTGDCYIFTWHIRGIGTKPSFLP